MKRAFGLVLATFLLAFSPAARGGNLYDAVLTETDLRTALEKTPVCVVVYQVGKESAKRQSIDRLVDLLRREADESVQFFRVDIAPFLSANREKIIRDIGHSEFPALVLYRRGAAVERETRPNIKKLDPVVERLKPFLLPPPPEPGNQEAPAEETPEPSPEQPGEKTEQQPENPPEPAP